MSALETSQATSPDTATAPLVAVEGLHTYYGKSHILHGVSLTVGRGEVVGLLGRNGVGKSTTLKTIMGLVSPIRLRRVVVLPAPLRPSSAVMRPSATDSDTPCRIWLLP